MQRMFVAGLILFAASVAPACSGRPTEPSETHGPEGTGGEAGESGTRYGPGDEARELRGGVELVMRFEQAAERFTGTVRNTTSQTVRLGAGETRPVELDARGQAFDWWTVHVELGSGAS